MTVPGKGDLFHRILAAFLDLKSQDGPFVLLPRVGTDLHFEIAFALEIILQIVPALFDDVRINRSFVVNRNQFLPLPAGLKGYPRKLRANDPNFDNRPGIHINRNVGEVGLGVIIRRTDDDLVGRIISPCQLFFYLNSSGLDPAR